ncbi:iron-containing redox enzyme family protein [Burkholderia ambifaria]|uniref:TenA family transcriptional regulator n=1 Tax=Burkholderia ambifaria TaxID=152480 RepID=UPI001E62A1E8|nr:iron-containing redox enzyme family protein [Burkholderia ambifaria]UEP23090.1 iron-containing redox enzyme family protein [Burkholderia ambifaria]UEP39834.1 iron-containing redox enzyme family protein [Burkholderia ambifaria]
MNDPFELSGDIMDLGSYPAWLRDVVSATDELKARIRTHPVFVAMIGGALRASQLHAFFVTGWAVVSQFPEYMAMNLMKTVAYRSRGDEKARRYLIRNIRVELNHVDHWAVWAAESGVTIDMLLRGDAPLAGFSLSHWCWKSCSTDALAPSIAATNYAVEAVTGEWSALLCASPYEQQFDPAVRHRAMRWLKLHSDYDDRHPWEALDIVATLLGCSPATRDVRDVEMSIRKSLSYFLTSLDCCMHA